MIVATTGILFGLIAIGLPVAVVLVVTALSLDHFYSFFPLLPGMGDILWGAFSNFTLIAVPLFIMTGEILLRSGIAQDMFAGVDLWVRRIPGGLLHTNIASSALFAATSGSSVATAATIGTVAMLQMERGGYKPPLFLGSIAAGGTLGILIPPSINMIIYGVLAEVSITRLYLAGLVPGVLLALLFSGMIFVAFLAFPSLGRGEHGRVSWAKRLAGLRGLLPPAVLFLLMVGSIYVGIATPTEAAAMGVLGAVAMVAIKGRLTWQLLGEVFESTMRVTCMVMFIVAAAVLLNFVLVGIGMTGELARFVAGLDVSPLTVMLALVAIYLLLGCFMETLSLMIATTPIVVPIITQLGYDPLWFGVLFMILIEAALITPPIGVNLFVVQSVRSSGSFSDVALGALPFLLMMIVMIGLLLAFPTLATWLPGVMRN
ncbi:TRAP transporter large permease [Oceanibacterium hippocampi]|uniref:TRAP transporter large permease protein n=1 Tax=Oceanibacterium hippocampi TaxID=745714 RepID=A0A1Y5TK84_9PROT|nr:TRAP transporter large permease [Oceanibacterium hippocampi]SLN65872.1 Sialic acid TRAP transporter permease protein SiaT [Oceanibacterium hippocampi]